MYHLKDDLEKDVPVQINAAEHSGNHLGFYLKSFVAFCMGGFCSELLTLFSDDTMKKETYWVEEVTGLSHSTSINSKCYIAATQTRSANVPFYKWYIQKVLIPFVIECQIASGAILPPALITCDGEDVIIQAMLNPELDDEFNDHRIAIAKGSASNSKTGNALDAGNFFKGSKKVAKYADEEDILLAKAASQQLVDSILGRKLPHWTKGKRDHLCDKFLRVMFAQKKTCTATCITHSFQNSGQLILDSSIDFLETKLAKCTIKATNVEYQIMRERFQEATLIVKDKGRLEEHEMDRMGIPQKRDSHDKRSTIKSDRPLSQQRGLILRHACVRAFYKAYQEKKNQDPLLRTEIASAKKAALADRKAAKLEWDAKSPEEKRMITAAKAKLTRERNAASKVVQQEAAIV